jgi:hypothetical protein
MIELDSEQSKAILLLKTAFELCRELNLNESFVLDFMFDRVPGAMDGQVNSYRRVHWTRSGCGQIQDAILAPVQEEL